MDKELLEELVALHAAVWTHFDPGMDKGDKLQPKAIKEALKSARKVLLARGRDVFSPAQ